MDVRGVIAGAIVVVLAAVGCTPIEQQYAKTGIGADLYWSEVASSTELQNIYLEALCRQISPVIGAQVDSGCAGVALPSAAWPQIVQAGMNDIDLRCDSYLSWLDQKKRQNVAILQEISDVRTAVETVMAVSPNPGPRTIAAIGAAFGLAAHTFTNVNGLLLQVDHTTVQAVVFGRRKDYRIGLERVAITNRPQAIHALRSYLDICLPITISTDINMTVTVYQQAGAGGLDKFPLINPGTVAGPRPGTVIGGPTDPMTVAPKPALRPDQLSDAERIPAPYVGRIQRALCVPEDGSLGRANSVTRLAIRDYLDGRNAAAPYVPTEGLSLENRQQLSTAVNQVVDCKANLFLNAFEVGWLGIPKERQQVKILDLQKALLVALKNVAPAVPVPQNGQLDPATRVAIAAARKATGTGSPTSQSIDQALRTALAP